MTNRIIKSFLLSTFVIVSIGILLWMHHQNNSADAQQEKASGSVQYLGIGDSNSTPSLASHGKWVVAVWTSNQQGHTNVHAATSNDGGNHFGAPVKVNDAQGEADVYGENPPRVAILPLSQKNEKPAILVTWSCKQTNKIRMRSALSKDGGQSFEPAISIGDPNTPGTRGFQSLAIGPQNVIRASWLDARRDPGTPKHANAGHGWDPMHLTYAYSSDGSSWAPEKRLATNVCGCCKTAIASGSDGTVYVVFRNIYPGDFRDISLAVSKDGKDFSKPVRVSEDHWSLKACPDDGPTMQVDQKGFVHMIWPTLVEKPEPAMRFFHASTRDGIKFTPRKQIRTLGSSKPAHAQMTLDSCGKLNLVWDEAEGTNRRIVLQSLTPLENGDIQPGDSQILSGSNPATYPVVASTGKALVVAWTESTKNGEGSSIALKQIPLGDCSKNGN